MNEIPAPATAATAPAGAGRAPRRGAVAVLGHYGQLNLGDESITAAAIDGVRAVRPDAEVIGISLDPRDTAVRHGVRSYALRREIARTPIERPRASTHAATGPSGGALGTLARRIPGLRAAIAAAASLPARLAGAAAEARAIGVAWRALTGVELVIVAGSNQLLDQFGGAWGFPWTLLKWTALARLRGARVVFLSVGAGPLDGWLGRRFVLWSLRLGEHVSVRDPGSAQLVRDLGWRRPVPVQPDLAFGFDLVRRPERQGRATDAAPGAGPLTVAVNVSPVHDARYWPGAQQRIRDGYVDAMTGFVERVLAAGHRVELYGTQPADEWVAEELIERIGARAPADRLGLLRVRTLDQLSVLYRRCDVIAATRFHGIVLALRYGRPVIGVCYYRKSRELMRDFGLERYAFDLDGVTAEQLWDAFAALVPERPAVERQMSTAAAARAAELLRQYRDVAASAEAVAA